MDWRHWLSGPLFTGLLLLACSPSDPTPPPPPDSGVVGGGGGGDGGGRRLRPAEFNAYVDPALPAGYSISGEQPYEWQAYILYSDAWVAVGSRLTSEGPSVHLVIDCNDPGMHDACTLHLTGMIQVTVTRVSPGPARFCAYKSGFLWRAGILWNIPLGSLRVAPVASSSQDPANAEVCYP